MDMHIACGSLVSIEDSTYKKQNREHANFVLFHPGLSSSKKINRMNFNIGREDDSPLPMYL